MEACEGNFWEEVTWAGFGRCTEVCLPERMGSTFQAERRESPEATSKRAHVLRECPFAEWPEAQGECWGW